MDDQETGPAPSRQETMPEERTRVFMVFGDEPLPDGVKVGDEGVFVIHVVPATREMVEAERAAEMEAENAA